MGTNDRFCVRDSVRLAVLATAGAVAAVAVGMGVYLHRFGWRAAQDWRQAALVELLAEQVRPLVDMANPDELAQWAARTVTGRAILAVAVLDADGQLVALRADRPELVAQIGRDAKTLAAGDVSGGSSPLGMKSGPGLLVSQPLRLDGAGRRTGRLVVLLSVGPDAADALGWFCLVVAGTALLMSAVASRWLNRRVAEPIEALAGVWQGAEGGDGGTMLLRERHDAVGRLARLIDSLHLQVCHWRERAELLEQTVDTRVAGRTRSIGVALKRAERRVWLDPLTGLTSRRFIDEKLPEIFAAQWEAGQDLALVMMDLDHFKRCNDSLGHPAGDDLLRFAGQLLRGAVRDSDIAARYGGDEFLLILPAVSAEQAATVARRAVAMFGQQAKTGLARRVGLGLSAGVASLRAHQPEDLAGLIRLADEALYSAKRRGQSVCVAGHEAAQAVPKESP